MSFVTGGIDYSLNPHIKRFGESDYQFQQRQRARFEQQFPGVLLASSPRFPQQPKTLVLPDWTPPPPVDTTKSQKKY
jgi:hypothetical protein